MSHKRVHDWCGGFDSVLVNDVDSRAAWRQRVRALNTLRQRTQASPLADQLRALLAQDPTLTLAELRARTGASEAYCSGVRSQMRGERGAS
jgi:hypothetical protein